MERAVAGTADHMVVVYVGVCELKMQPVADGQLVHHSQVFEQEQRPVAVCRGQY